MTVHMIDRERTGRAPTAPMITRCDHVAYFQGLDATDDWQLVTCPMCREKPPRLREDIRQLGEGLVAMLRRAVHTIGILIAVVFWAAGLITVGIFGCELLSGWEREAELRRESVAIQREQVLERARERVRQEMREERRLLQGGRR